jgi:uncharacterized damage-inducible protein DinB
VNEVARQFLRRSASQLRDLQLPRILEAVERLSEEDIWRRDGSASNSIGNLLLHLEGNVRQHVISGVGGVPDVRNRPAEFAATGGHTKAELLDRLARTVAEACSILEALDPALVLERRVIQNKEVILLDDIYTIVEHFAYHAGQIIYCVKARTQSGFPWYTHLDPKR